MSSEEYPVQRRTPRYPFVAPAAVLPETGAPIGGNVKELSLYGCYLGHGVAAGSASQKCW